MKDIEIIDNEHSLLVSDSNEVSEQFDSRRLKYSLLLELSQDCLFNRHLGIMNGYLSTNQFDVKYDVQTSAYERVKQQWDSIKNVQWDGKFKVVPGQVILIEKSKLPTGVSPADYVYQHWNIPSNYYLESISDCMLRGSTEISRETVSGKKEIELLEENIPPHMHNSSITDGTNMKSVSSKKKSNSNNDGVQGSGFQVNLFHDDSISVGLQNNELDGTVDEFTPQKTGKDVVFHNNIPSYREFYAFEVKMN